jgi:hypothetical protein
VVGSGAEAEELVELLLGDQALVEVLAEAARLQAAAAVMRYNAVRDVPP